MERARSEEKKGQGSEFDLSISGLPKNVAIS
jgi:hypothetical protein